MHVTEYSKYYEVARRDTRDKGNTEGGMESEPKMEMKKECKKCEYWTKNPKHGNYRCYTSKCPAYQQDRKDKV